MDMQCQHKNQWLMIFGLFFLLIFTSNWTCHAFALSPDQVSSVGSGDGRIFGCLPCSRAYLASSFFDRHNSLLESDFHDFLAQEFGAGDLCRGLANDMNVLGLADLHRHLSSEALLMLLLLETRIWNYPLLYPTDQLSKFTWILGNDLLEHYESVIQLPLLLDI